MFAGAHLLIALLVLAGVVVVVLALLRGRTSTARHTARARSMAAHPSAAGPGQRTWTERKIVATDLADELAGEGFVCSRPSNTTIVHARDADGQYLVNVGRSSVLVAHHADTTYDRIGEFDSPYEAVLAVLDHSELHSTP